MPENSRFPALQRSQGFHKDLRVAALVSSEAISNFHSLELG